MARALIMNPEILILEKPLMTPGQKRGWTFQRDFGRTKSKFRSRSTFIRDTPLQSVEFCCLLFVSHPANDDMSRLASWLPRRTSRQWWHQSRLASWLCLTESLEPTFCRWQIRNGQTWFLFYDLDFLETGYVIMFIYIYLHIEWNAYYCILNILFFLNPFVNTFVYPSLIPCLLFT